MSETDISPEVMRAFIEADYCAARDRFARRVDPQDEPYPELSFAAYVAMRSEMGNSGAWEYGPVANDETKSPALRDFCRQMVERDARVEEERKRRPFARTSNGMGWMIFGRRLHNRCFGACLRTGGGAWLFELVPQLAASNPETQKSDAMELLGLLEEYDRIVDKILQLSKDSYAQSEELEKKA